MRNPFRGKIQKGCVQTAAQIADARTFANVRIGGLKSLPRDKSIQSGVGHLYELVVADVRAAADSQHTQEE